GADLNELVDDDLVLLLGPADSSVFAYTALLRSNAVAEVDAGRDDGPVTGARISRSDFAEGLADVDGATDGLDGGRHLRRLVRQKGDGERAERLRAVLVGGGDHAVVDDDRVELHG